MEIKISIPKMGQAKGTVGWLKENIKNVRISKSKNGTKGVYCDMGDQIVHLCHHDEEMREYVDVAWDHPCIITLKGNFDYINIDYGQGIDFLTPAARRAMYRLADASAEKLKEIIDKDDEEDFSFSFV